MNWSHIVIKRILYTLLALFIILAATWVGPWPEDEVRMIQARIRLVSTGVVD
jgi:hypothetical protein